MRKEYKKTNMPRWKYELKAYQKNRKNKVTMPYYTFMEKKTNE